MRETAIARYQRAAARQKAHPTQTIGKRVRKTAWREASALIASGLRRDTHVIQDLRADAAKRVRATADALYGPQQYGRDTQQPIIIPLYHWPLPAEPEMGFAFVAVLGKRKHLWHDGAWVKLSGALMREVGASGLRVALAMACRFQEARVWASHSSALRFRDQVIDVKHFYRNAAADEEWGHTVPRIRGRQ